VKRFFSIGLGLTYGLVLVQANLPALHYALNPAAYAANCVNKNQPQLGCEGKCQLMQEMQNASSPDPGTAEGRLIEPLPEWPHMLPTTVALPVECPQAALEVPNIIVASWLERLKQAPPTPPPEFRG